MSRPFHPADQDPVPAALRGFARAHADLVQLHERPTHLVAKQRNASRRVGLVSGGGSGHEPLHAGFLGRGMLDAVAPGRIFASPHNRQVLEASRKAAEGMSGVVHVVKNYTGDRINFGIAAERLRADGIEVRRVLVDDDLATESDQTATGRRGTGATVIIEKLLGGAADTGLGLGELAEAGGAFRRASRSIAVAGRAQTSPSRGGEAFALGDEEVEYGVGIHGERAAETITRPPFEELTERMTAQVLAALPDTGDGVILLVNGLGATTLLELYAVYEQVCEVLEKRGVRVAGQLVGTYVPALDMSGFSLTMTAVQPDWLAWWQAPSRTPAFPSLPRS